MTIPFVKMHGLGNDYVFLDAVAEPALARRDDLPALARAMSARRRGVGADGLIIVSRPSEPGREADAAVRMRIFNADGSDGGMCGNGARCAVKLAIERGYATVAADVRIETEAGVLIASAERDPHGRVTSATVDMGAPSFDPESLPADTSRLERAGDDPPRWRVGPVEGVLVSVGNPHVVAFFNDSIESVDLARIGPEVERHPAFPQRVNLQLAHVVDRSRALVRTWERGAGATAACGTGACAVLAAGVRLDMLDRVATITLPGGDLFVRWDEATGRISQSGPTTEVFRGEWPCDAAAPGR